MQIDKIRPKKIPDEFNVIIEIPMNDNPVKYELDKESGAIFVDRFMQVSMFYPCNYGFIPNTLSGDGDPVDVLVLSNYPVIPGAIVKCRPIGVLMMKDESGLDEKIIAVPVYKVDIKDIFFSVFVATKGGERPIASSRNVYRRIDNSIKERFKKNGIMYVRNYTPGVEVDLSWQDVFQNQQRDEVDRFCKEHGIEVRWNNSGPQLTTRQVCQATIKHSITGESVWFNQAYLFHISALEESDRFSLIKEPGENNIPRNTFYGDDSSIEVEVLEHIRKVYSEEKIKFKWHKGDIMILDNVLTAHAREPFKGERKVAVVMA